MKYSPVRSRPPHAWRPWPLRPLFFACFTILCLLLCILIELVVRGCSDDGCHVFGGLSSVNLSRRTNFAYNQLPLVITVSLGFLWAVAHHDVIRLEPYFRMSVPGGTTAADSIFLEYSYDFGPFIPYYSMIVKWAISPPINGESILINRHYVVLLSSCVLLLISFVVVPLMAGIFNDTTLERRVLGHGYRATIPSLGIVNMSTSFTYYAYNHAWHQTPLPAFTNLDPPYAVLPVLNTTELNGGDDTWSADTTLFEAALTCETAGNITFTDGTEMTGIITSQTGGHKAKLCDQIRTGRENSDCNAYVTFVTPWTSIALRVSQGNGSSVFMFAWAAGADPKTQFPGSPPPINITAIFCSTHYFSQPVRANFTVPGGEIVLVDRTDVGGRSPFIEVTQFEQIINAEFDVAEIPEGYRNTAGDLVALGYIPPLVPNTDSQLRQRLGTRPTGLNRYFSIPEGAADLTSYSVVYMDNVHGLQALILSDRSPDNLAELLDPKRLAAAYERTIQTLFALAVTVEIADSHIPELVPITRHLFTRGFVVSQFAARATQLSLTVVILILIVLAVKISWRPCNLDGEPNTLAEALRLLAVSPELCAKLENSEFHNQEEILEVFNKDGARYILDLVPEQGPMVRAVGVTDNSRLLATASSEPPTQYQWPLWIITGVGFVSCFVIVGLAVALAFVFSISPAGLQTFGPVQSPLYRFLFSILPTALGMAVEPILLSIATCHCMLAPYIALKPGPASASQSLTVDFDKSPPHFQLFRAISTGNIALAGLSTVLLLSKILAVAMGGLFSPTTTCLNLTTEVYTYGTPRIHGLFTEPAQEMYFTLAEQFSGTLAEDLAGTTAVPRLNWTASEYYVLPVHPVNSASVEEYQVSTIGIGVNITCSVIPAEDIGLVCEDSGAGGTSPCTDVLTEDTNKKVVIVDDPCWEHMVANNRQGQYGGLHSQTASPSVEYKWSNITTDDMIASSRCPGTLFVLWLEQPANPNPTPQTIYLDRPDALVLKCATVDNIVELTATIDKELQVLSSTVVRPLDTSEVAAWYPSPANTTARLSPSFIAVITDGLRRDNSKDTHKLRWFNYLMVIRGYNGQSITREDLTNITHIPNDTVIAAAFEDVYRRLFAINLKLYMGDIISPGEQLARTVPAVARIRVDRVKVSHPNSYIAMFILAVIIVVLVVLYSTRKQPDGHVPTSLAKMYALLYASNVKEICRSVDGVDPKERAENLEKLEERYKYGRIPGGIHYGVYCEGVVEKE